MGGRRALSDPAGGQPQDRRRAGPGGVLRRGGPGGGEDDEAPYTSARNAFPGIVTGIRLGSVSAQVEIQAGPHRVVSLLTREAVEELGLEVGMRATARVKSTSVFVDRT